jgi:hypothetical protein
MRGVGWVFAWVLALSPAVMAASPPPAPVSDASPALAKPLVDVYAGPDRAELLRVLARHWRTAHPKEPIRRVFLPAATWTELRVMVPQNGQRVCREGERLEARVAVDAGSKHWRVYRVNFLRFKGEPAGVSEAGSELLDRPR